MEEKSIEKCFSELDEILSKMEAEDTGLEESFRLYEKGIELVKAAKGNIDRVEKELQVLSGEEKEEQ